MCGCVDVWMCGCEGVGVGECEMGNGCVGLSGWVVKKSGSEGEEGGRRGEESHTQDTELTLVVWMNDVDD